MSRALEGPASPGCGAEPAPSEGRERFRTHSTNRDRGRAAGLWGLGAGALPEKVAVLLGFEGLGGLRPETEGHADSWRSVSPRGRQETT